MSRDVDRVNLTSRIGAAVSDYLASKEPEYEARATLTKAILAAVDLTTGEPTDE